MFATRYSGRAIKLGLTEEAGVAVRAGFASPVAQVAESYSFAHVLCQPSRAEGFGMCGLEARACGVPVVATACTGHSEWMPATEEERRSSGVVLVPHGEEAPSDDFLGAKAPSVSSAEIAVALLDARARWEALSEAAIASAEHVQSYWAWERVTEPALRHIVADAEQAP
jgi:glycosyltransferase involved in cell wall biosynthesis